MITRTRSALIGAVIFAVLVYFYCLWFPPAWESKWSAIIAVFSAQGFFIGWRLGCNS